MTTTREEVILVARECGITFVPMVVDGIEYQFRHVRFHDPNCDSDEADCIERLAQHFYEAGAAASREPLSDEHIRKASLQAGMQEHYMGFHSGFIRFVRAVEQAHGIAKATGEKT